MSKNELERWIEAFIAECKGSRKMSRRRLGRNLMIPLATGVSALAFRGLAKGSPADTAFSCNPNNTCATGNVCTVNSCVESNLCVADNHCEANDSCGTINSCLSVNETDCTHDNICHTRNECGPGTNRTNFVSCTVINACVGTDNICHSNACTGTNSCLNDDWCTLNSCIVEDTDCGWCDISQIPIFGKK